MQTHVRFSAAYTRGAAAAAAAQQPARLAVRPVSASSPLLAAVFALAAVSAQQRRLSLVLLRGCDAACACVGLRRPLRLPGKPEPLTQHVTGTREPRVCARPLTQRTRDACTTGCEAPPLPALGPADAAALARRRAQRSKLPRTCPLLRGALVAAVALRRGGVAVAVPARVSARASRDARERHVRESGNEVRTTRRRRRARVRRLRRTRTAPPRLQWQAARKPARAPLRGAAGLLATRTHRRRDEHASQRRSKSRLA